MKDLSKRSLQIGFILEVLIVIYSYFEANGNLTPFFQTSARLSGRVSLLFFAILLIYHTLQPNCNEKEIIDVKYTLSKNFAIIHIIHWFFLAFSVYLTQFDLVPLRVAGGAFAYFIIILLPLAIKGKILKRMALSKIFNFYLFYVWLIFFMTYVTRLTNENAGFTGSKTSYIALITFTIFLMLWRVFILIKKVKNEKTGITR